MPSGRGCRSRYPYLRRWPFHKGRLLRIKWRWTEFFFGLGNELAGRLDYWALASALPVHLLAGAKGSSSLRGDSSILARAIVRFDRCGGWRCGDDGFFFRLEQREFWKIFVLELGERAGLRLGRFGGSSGRKVGS